MSNTRQLSAVFAALSACSQGSFRDGERQSAETPRNDGSAPLVRIVEPNAGSAISGVFELAVSASAPERPMSFTVALDDQTLATFDDLADAYAVDSSQFTDGAHRLTVTIHDAEGREASDSLDVTVANAPFRLLRVRAAQEEVLRGTEVQIEATYSAPGLTVNADFGAIDSEYRVGSEIVETVSSATTRVRYVISSQNSRAQGRYIIPLTARDATGHVLQSNVLSLTLLPAPRAPFQMERAAFLLTESSTPSGNADAPTVAVVRGSGSIITGGTAQIEFSFDDPQGLTDVTHAVVRVTGFSGHYLMPIVFTGGSDADGGGESSNTALNHALLDLFLPSATGLPNGFAFPVQIALVDRLGNVSAYAEHVIQLVQVMTGDVQVSLSWDSPTDVDLHVVEPSGEELFYGNISSATGGTLDLDSNSSCFIDGVNNENIAWPAGQAPTGEYVVRVDYWSSCGGQSTTGRVTVQACGEVVTHTTFSTGQALTFAGSEADGGGAGSGREVVRFTNRCGHRMTGRVRYEREDALTGIITVLDMPHMPIEVRRTADGEVLGRGLTNYAGEFTIAYERDGNSAVDVYVLARRGDPDQDAGVVVSHDQERVWEHRLNQAPIVPEDGQPTDLGEVAITVADGSGAYHILTVISRGIDFLFGRVPYFSEARLTPRLTVLWEPEGFQGGKGTLSSRYDRTAALLTIAGQDDRIDQFDDSVILREFGHHVIQTFSHDNSPAGTDSSDNAVDPRLAWSEGVATFFASAVLNDPIRRNFDQGLVKIVNVEKGQRVAEGAMRSDSGYGTSDGTMAGNVTGRLVAAVLWDFLDSANPLDPDLDSLENPDAGRISNVLFDYLMARTPRDGNGVDLTDFLDGWFCQGFGQEENVSLLLSDHTSQESDADGQPLHQGRNFPYDFGYRAVCSRETASKN